MLDWVMSKIAMSVVAVILILLGVGYIESQRDSLEQLELRNTARGLADLVNELAGTNSNITIIVSPAGEHSSGYLPATIAGKAYTIQIMPQFVAIEQDGVRRTGQFSEIIHPWQPTTTVFTNEDIDRQDTAATPLAFKSGVKVHSKRQMITVDGDHQWHTFVYLE